MLASQYVSFIIFFCGRGFKIYGCAEKTWEESARGQFLCGVKNVLNEVHLYKLSLAHNVTFQGYASPGLLRNNLVSSFPLHVVC